MNTTFKSIFYLSLLFFLILSNQLYAQFNGRFDIIENRLFIESFLDYKIYSEETHSINRLQGNQFSYTAGVLTKEKLYTHQYLFFKKQIKDNLNFSYQQTQESLYREGILYQEAELSLGEQFFVSLLGMGDHSKSSNNTGIGFGLKKEEFFSRLSFIQTGETQYNIDNSQFSSLKYIVKPVLIRAEYNILDENYTLNTTYKLELEALAEDYSNASTLKYSGYEFNLNFKKRLDEKRSLKIVTKIDEEHRINQFKNSTTNFPNKNQTIKLQWYDVSLALKLDQAIGFEAGVIHSSFLNEINTNFRKFDFYYLNQANQFYVVTNYTFREFRFGLIFQHTSGEQTIKESNYNEKIIYKQNRISTAINYTLKDAKLIAKASVDLDNNEELLDGSLLGIQISF